MPLYEVLLRDGYDETRLTDTPLTVGETITMLGREWMVVSEEPAQDGIAGRFGCIPARGARQGGAPPRRYPAPASRPPRHDASCPRSPRRPPGRYRARDG